MGALPSQAALRAALSYDPETGQLHWKARGKACFDTRFAGAEAFTACDNRGYPIGSIFGCTARAHRVIWKLVHGEEAAVIDHIDRDRSNNRLRNLRSVSQQENLHNRGPYKARLAEVARRAGGKLRAVAA